MNKRQAKREALRTAARLVRCAVEGGLVMDDMDEQDGDKVLEQLRVVADELEARGGES